MLSRARPCSLMAHRQLWSRQSRQHSSSRPTCVIDIQKDDSGKEASKQDGKREVDPIMLSIFGHRFMAIAEQMGRALRRPASVPTSRKGWTSRAPSLMPRADSSPMHPSAGASGIHVNVRRRQAEIWRGISRKATLSSRTIHPAGGTHLPDVTLTDACVQRKQGDKILFYAASRRRTTPILEVSQPEACHRTLASYSRKCLDQVGKDCQRRRFNEERVIELFYKEPAQFPGCSGTRCLADNINDLRAQVSANQKGIS